MKKGILILLLCIPFACYSQSLIDYGFDKEDAIKIIKKAAPEVGRKTAIYKRFEDAWSKFSNDNDKSNYIRENRTELEELGIELSINNLNKAYSNSEALISSIKNRALANALYALAEEDYANAFILDEMAKLK